MAQPEKLKRVFALPVLKESKSKFSRFFCQQFLFDYIFNDLDVNRMGFLEDQLKADEELKFELESLRVAHEYCLGLGQLKIHHEMMEKFLSQKTIWETTTARFRFRNWPDFLKWSLEALSLGVFIAFVMLIIPWDKIENQLVSTKRQEFFLVSKKSLIQEQEETQVALSPQDKEKPKAPVDLASNVAKIKTPENLPPVAAQMAEPKVPPAPIATEIPAPQDLPEAVSPPPVPAPEAAPPKAKSSVTVEVGATQPTRALRGELFRLYMKVANVDEVTATIAAEIEKLGGLKAGEVPLGWRKDGGSYFHFTIPTSNHEALLNQIKLLGPVTEQKESHWRVMPEGSQRMILNVVPKESP